MKIRNVYATAFCTEEVCIISYSRPSGYIFSLQFLKVALNLCPKKLAALKLLKKA